MLGGGVQELRRVPDLVEAAQRLGYPDYIFTILGTAKIIGAPLLVIQRWPRLKEWVYAGFTFDFGGAIVSHTIVGDTLFQTLPAFICAGLLALSYWSYRRRGLQPDRNPFLSPAAKLAAAAAEPQLLPVDLW